MMFVKKSEKKPRLKLTLLECEDQLVRVRDAAADPACDPASAAKLGHEVRSLLKLRAHLEAAQPYTIDKMCDSEAWKQLSAKIADAIASCDKCSAALESVLSKGDS